MQSWPLVWPSQRSESLFQNARVGLKQSHFLFMHSSVWVPWGRFLDTSCWPSHLSYSVAGDHLDVIGAMRPVSGSNQSCHTGIVGSSPAVGSGRWSQLPLPHFWSCGVLSLALAASIASGILPFDSRVNQGRAGLGQAVLLKSWAYTHSDETLSWKDGGNWNTLLKGEDPKQNSWSNGKIVEGNFQLNIRKSSLATDFCWCVE